MRVEDLPRIIQSQINNNTLLYVSNNGLPFSSTIIDVASQISGVTGTYIINSQLSGTSGVLNNKIDILSGNILGIIQITGQKNFNSISGLSGYLLSNNINNSLLNLRNNGQSMFSVDSHGGTKFGILNSTTGDFNYFDSTTTGLIRIQAGSALNSNSESVITLTNQNAIRQSNISNGGFGLSVFLDDNEGELGFLTNGDGHSTLYLYDFYHAGITFVPGNNIIQSRDATALITVDGSPIDSNNLFGRSLTLKAEDNINSDIGGNIVLIPGTGNGYGQIISSGDTNILGNLTISGNSVSLNSNVQNTGQIIYKYITGLSGLVSPSHLVFNTGNQTISGNKTFPNSTTITTASGTSYSLSQINNKNAGIVFDITNQTIYDRNIIPNSPSLDWGHRFLSDSGSITSLVWGSRQTLDNANILSIDWQNRILSGNNSSYFDWNGGIFYGVDNNGQTISMVNYQLFDNTQTNSLNWSNRSLFGQWNCDSIKSTTTDAVVNIVNQQISETTGPTPVLDWGTQNLLDLNFVSSLDWSNRLLLAGDGSTVLDWNNQFLTGTWVSDLLYTTTLVLSQKVPATSTSAGLKGQIATSGAFLYIATGTNLWGRVALSSW